MGRSNTVTTLAKLQTVGRFGHAWGRYDEALADLDHAIELNYSGSVLTGRLSEVVGMRNDCPPGRGRSGVARMPLRDGDPSRIGRFRLTARLGAGGMGVVYLGTAKDGTQAAIKVLRPELADDPDFRVRFRREVAMLARVNGLCTVRVLEADIESARPFLATEYADGPSLAEYVSQHGPLGPDMLQGLAVGLAEALTAIHTAGVIHRDLKPGNVLLTQSGPKVIDFGIAQALDSTSLTKTGMTVGSPGFMAPEQILGQAAQPADIFAWGLTVAYAATGHSPFGTGPTDAVLYRIMHEAPDVSGVPEQLRPIVEGTLLKNPAERPTAQDLLTWAASPIISSDDGADVKTQMVLARTWLLPARDLPGAAPSRPRRGRWMLALSTATAVAIAVGAGSALLVNRTHQARPAASDPGGTAATHSPLADPVSTGSASPAPPASPVAAPSPSVSGGIFPGTEQCGFTTSDGDYQVYALAEQVADCDKVSQALASFGTYWEPLSPDTITQQKQGGALMDVNSYCHLSASGGMNLSIYSVAQGAKPAPDQLAKNICVSEEANGWAPHVSTQS
jgi:eukaryotic-like serine/threonine-protein kinase